MRTPTLSIIMFAGLTSPAFAYLDPGTGTIMLQGLIAAVAGGLFILKVYWQRFLQIVGLRKPNDANPTGKNDQSES